jgi:oxygen-independent coproporphyrinogen-3 oxidase
MGLGNASVWNNPRVKARMDAESLLPPVRVTYEMRSAIMEVFAKYGYLPSPCGWWNKPDVYPDGNIPQVSRDKWQKYNSMLGFGPGAYGWLTGSETTFIQTHNQTDVATYMRHMERGSREVPPLAYGRLLAGHRAVGTKLCFGYKANQPIHREEYRALFGIDLGTDEPYASVFAHLEAKGFVRYDVDGDFWLPTLTGEAVHEEIMFTYFHERIGASTDAFCKRGV